MKRALAALVIALAATSATAIADSTPTPPPLTYLPTAAHNLTATLTKSGFVLNGDLLFNTTCMSSGFETLVPGLAYFAVTWRSAPPDARCGFVTGFTPESISVIDAHPAKSITVLTSEGLTTVTIAPAPAQ